MEVLRHRAHVADAAVLRVVAPGVDRQRQNAGQHVPWVDSLDVGLGVAVAEVGPAAGTRVQLDALFYAGAEAAVTRNKADAASGAHIESIGAHRLEITVSAVGPDKAAFVPHGAARVAAQSTAGAAIVGIGSWDYFRTMAAREAVVCTGAVVVAADHGTAGTKGGISRTAGDRRVASGGDVVLSTTDTGLVAAGVVVVATGNHGVVARRTVPVAAADARHIAVSLVAAATGNRAPVLAGAVVLATADAAAQATGDVIDATGNRRGFSACLVADAAADHGRRVAGGVVLPAADMGVAAGCIVARTTANAGEAG